MAKKSLYFLAIVPEGKVKEEVMGLKLELAEKFHSKSALKSPPHITLHMPFQWRSDREEQLIERLGQFPFEGFPFDIELKDFDFFEPKVVYVGVRHQESLVRLQKELVTYMRLTFNLFNADYKDKPFHPHMTIGFRDLKKSLFPEIKKYYDLKKYSAKFEAAHFCLLRHNGKFWDELVYMPSPR